MRDQAQGIERLVLLPQARRALGVASNRTLKRTLQKHGVPLIVLSSKTKALSESAYRMLLERASIREIG